MRHVPSGSTVDSLFGLPNSTKSAGLIQEGSEGSTFLAARKGIYNVFSDGNHTVDG